MKLAALGIFTLGLMASPVRAQDGGIAVGTIAPNATLQTLDGKRIELSSLLGKTPVVLEFWATWCSSCEELEPTFQQVQRKYAGKVRFAKHRGGDQSISRTRAPLDRASPAGPRRLLRSRWRCR